MQFIKNLWERLWTHPAQLIWIVLAYVPFLGLMSVPLTGDQKVYLSTALEMKLNSSFLRPMMFGEPSYYKPPLNYWAMLGGWEIFGFNLWGALLPSVLCLVLTSWLLNEISKLLNDKIRFRNAGLWFAITLGAVTYGTTAQMEIYVCLFYAAAWFCALKFLKVSRENRNWIWLYLAFLIAGLSSLVKSPLYSVLWVVSFWFYLFIEGEWEIFSKKGFFFALFLGMIAGAAWYLVVIILDGKRFFSDYLMRETWQKNSGNGGTAGSLWLALLYYCIPFTLLLLPSLKALRSRRRGGRIFRFILAWGFPPALFFSLYPYRVKPYFFLLVPAMALLVEWGHFQLARSRAFHAMSAFTGAVCLVVTCIGGFILYRVGFIELSLMVALMVVGAFIFVSLWANWINLFLFSGLCAVLAFRIVAIQIGQEDIKALREFVRVNPTAQLAMLDEKKNIWHEIGLIAASIEKPIIRIQRFDEVTSFLKNNGVIVLSDEQVKEHEKDINQLPFKTKQHDWPRWKGRLRFPYGQLLFGGENQKEQLLENMKRHFTLISVAVD